MIHIGGNDRRIWPASPRSSKEAAFACGQIGHDARAPKVAVGSRDLSGCVVTIWAHRMPVCPSPEVPRRVGFSSGTSAHSIRATSESTS